MERYSCLLPLHRLCKSIFVYRLIELGYFVPGDQRPAGGGDCRVEAHALHRAPGQCVSVSGAFLKKLRLGLFAQQQQKQQKTELQVYCSLPQVKVAGKLCTNSGLPSPT